MLGVSFLSSIVPRACQNGPCGMCDLFKGISNLINFFVFQIGPIAAGLMILIGGAMWVVNNGNQEQVKKGQDILKATIIGLIIMYSAWMIINTILITIATGPAGQGIQTNWYNFNCRPEDNSL